MTPDSVLTTHDLQIGYQSGRTPPMVVADALNLQLTRGKLVCLLGPNGAGKSTLLRTLAGIQSPLAGTVHLAGQDIHQLAPQQLARLRSVVFTERVTPDGMTGYALVALGRHPYTDWSGNLTDDDHQKIEWAMTTIGVVPFANRHIQELSDGERQKLMIARALAQDPHFMILDEPTAFLDLPNRIEVMQVLHRLASEEERTVLLSTHDLELALRMADVLWLMPTNGQIRVGIPEQLILDEAFTQVFPQLAFDVNSGTFAIERETKGTVVVIGDNVQAFWTRRAMTRLGYDISEKSFNSTFPIIDVTLHGWVVQKNNKQVTFTRLEDTLKYLG